MLVFGHLLQVLLLRIFHVQVHHVTAGNHQRGDLALVQAEHVAYHDVLALLDDPGFGAFGQQRVDFLFRHLLLGVRIDPHAAQDQVGGTGERHHERARDQRQDAHGTGGQPGHGLGADLAQTLGNQFADNDGHIGDQHDHQRGGQHLGRLLGHAQRQQPARQRFGEGGLTDDTVQHPDGGDADLDGGEKAGGVFTEGQGGRGALVAFGHQTLQSRLACREQRHFRHGEQAIEHDQAQQDGGFHQRLSWRDRTWRDGMQATIMDPHICARSSMSAGCPKAGVKKGVPQRWRDGGSGSVIIDTDRGTCPDCLPGFWMSPGRAGTGRSEKC